MKNTLLISTLLLLILDSYYNKCNGQTEELPRSNNRSIRDTIFFEIDPKLNNAHIFFEELPEFPGGEKALKDYISENTHYPQSAIKDSISGLVTLTFDIDIDGSTKNCKVLRSVNIDLDNECIRVINEMPEWKPGSSVFRAKKGLYRKIIPMSYVIIFNFDLNDNEDKIGIKIKPK